MALAVLIVVGSAVLISGAYAEGANGSKTTNVTVFSSMTIYPSSQAILTSTQVANKTATVTVVTSPSFTPTATSPTIHPTKPGPTPNHTTAVIPTTQGHNTTQSTMRSTIPTPNPTTQACPKCKSCAKEVHAKWVAVAFSILFGVTTVVMAVLYGRQRKIYRDLEGDSSLSRLI